MTSQAGRPMARRRVRGIQPLLISGLCLVATALVVLFAPGGDGPAPGNPAFALRCPAGWNVRGINCCRVRGGQPVCQRNPLLPNAIAPLLADRADLVQPIQVDDSDLTDEAIAADPSLAPRPITTDPRILDPADDTCVDAACDFGLIRSIAEIHRDGNRCIRALRTHYCSNSMWQDLDLEQRLQRILVLGRGLAEDAGVDVRALPCIAAIETRYLEPLTVSEFNCTGYTSDQGLPQIIRPTFDGLRERRGFRSSVVPYGESEDPAHWDRVFAEIAQSVRHQLELMAQVLRESGGQGTESGYLNAFINYNGSSRSIAYGFAVSSCLACMRERVDVESFEMQGDPVRCLSAALGGVDIREQFEDFRGLCSAQDPAATAGRLPQDLELVP